MRLDYWSSGVLVLALIDDVNIFFQGRADRRHVLLLLARSVKAALGIQRVDLLVALENLNDRQIAAVVCIFFLRVRTAQQRIWPERHFVAERHFFFSFAVEGRSQDSEEDQRHAKVDDIASVTSRISVPQANHRSRKAAPGMARDHAPAADEL